MRGVGVDVACHEVIPGDGKRGLARRTGRDGCGSRVLGHHVWGRVAVSGREQELADVGHGRVGRVTAVCR